MNLIPRPVALPGGNIFSVKGSCMGGLFMSIKLSIPFYRLKDWLVSFVSFVYDYTSKPGSLSPQIVHVGFIMYCVFQEYESSPEPHWPDRLPFFLCHREWADSRWFPGQAEQKWTLVSGWKTEVCVWEEGRFQTPWPSINPHNYPSLNYIVEEAWLATQKD